MPQLPFGFDPDSGTFSNIKLPPPRVNNNYSTSPVSTTGGSYSPRRSWWRRFDRFISNIGNWFAENFDDVVAKISLVLFGILVIGAVIAVIGIWINEGFIIAILAAIGALIVLGLIATIGGIILTIMTGIIMFVGRFIFWNAITFILFLCAIGGGWISSYFDHVDKPVPTETVAKVTPTTYTCTASVLNVRSEPNTSSSIRGALYRGQQVKVLEITGSFARIDYKGGNGYIATQYIQPVEQQ